MNNFAPKYVRIKLLECKNLLPMDLNGFSDPFVVVRLRVFVSSLVAPSLNIAPSLNGDKKHKKNTEIVHKSLNPVWTEHNEYTFKVQNALTDFLKVTKGGLGRALC